MPDWPEDEFVFVSAIEHYSYCPRQCALIHVEHVFDENLYTLRGHDAHERVHEGPPDDEDGKRVERGLPIWSARLGLHGKADAVEFWADGCVYPVEYKYGRRRSRIHDDLQLCAQALCLEEMLGVSIARGAVYHCSSKRRREVSLDDQLRAKTEQVVREIREMQKSGILPPPANDARCPTCSLVDACIPAAAAALREPTAARDLFRPTESEVTE